MTETIVLPDGSTLTQTSSLQSFSAAKKYPGHTLTPHTDTLQLADGVATVEHTYIFTPAQVTPPPPPPPPTGLIWSDGLTSESQVTYDSSGQGHLTGFGNIEGGTKNPSYTVTPRVTVVELGGRMAIKKVVYNADPASVMPSGSSPNPAASANSPGLVTLTENNVGVVQFSVWMPGPGNTRGENPLPLIKSGAWCQVFEMYGTPYAGSPPWEIDISSPDGINNYWTIPGVAPHYENRWVSVQPIQTECWNDFEIGYIFDTQASTDGKTHGLIFLNFGPNAGTTFGSTLALQEFVQADAPLFDDDTVMGLVTAGPSNWNGGANTLNFPLYHKSGLSVDPVFAYHSEMGLAARMEEV